MKGLFLYGIGCTNDIWKDLKDKLKDIDITYVEYPNEITADAENVSDITKWVYEKYGDEKYDFIVGHSLGGIVGLELASAFGLNTGKVIFIDSNLKPAAKFYRNLLTPKHMQEYGKEIIEMFNKEFKHYSKSLIDSVQENFDFTRYIENSKCKIYGIYGDRGVSNYDKRITDLMLNEDVVKSINFYFAEDSCHMPMIENPEGLFDIISAIISD